MGGILFLDTLSSSSSSLIMNAFHLEKFLKNLLHYDGGAQWLFQRRCSAIIGFDSKIESG